MKKEEEEDAGAAVVNEMQRAAGLCENIRKTSIFKEYKDIRKEEDAAGAAGLKKQRKRKIAVKHAWKTGGSRIHVFIGESLQVQCLQGFGSN